MKLYTGIVGAAAALIVWSASCLAQRTYTATPIATPYSAGSLIWISDDAKSGYGIGTNYAPGAAAPSFQCFVYDSGQINPLLTPGLDCGAVAANTGVFLLKTSTPFAGGSQYVAPVVQFFEY